MNDKYSNWRVLIESDYLSLFVKAWFAFLATLQEINPEIETQGDGDLINAYSQNCINYLCIEGIMDGVISNIKNAYIKSNHLFQSIYPQHFFKTFYSLNKEYSFIHDGIEGGIKISISISQNKGQFRLNTIVHRNTKRFNEYFDFYLSSMVDLSAYTKDLSFLNKDNLITAVEDSLIENGKSKISEKDRLSARGIKYREDYLHNSVLPAIQTWRGNFEGEYIFNQMPQKNFPEAADDINSILTWFIKFLYRLRNVMFHIVIDPLDKEWQDIFKYSYLALKDIVDCNIEWLTRNERTLNQQGVN